MDTTWAQHVSFVPPGHVGPATIVVLMLGLFGAVCGSLLLAAFSYWLGLRRARQEESAMLEESATKLRPGPRRTVRGKVERTGGADREAPVEVDIVEMVHDHSNKNSHWHTWEETNRVVRAEPFRLVRDDGTLVSVEPGGDVLVVDSLVSSYPQDRPLHRIRSAIIAHGAEVHVYGDLHRVTSHGDGPYRGSGAEFALRPPRAGTMLIATQSLRKRHDGVLQMLGRWLVGLFCGYALAHAAITVPFLLTSAFHDDTEATVQNARIETLHTKNGVRYTYLITVMTEDGWVLRDQEVPPETYTEIEQRRHDRTGAHKVAVPVLRTFDRQALSFIGTEPHVINIAPIAAVVLGLLLGAGALIHCRTKLAWYDMKKVTEHGGDGHWVEPRPHHPVVERQRA